MDDLIEAIRLEPKYALAYNDRSFALVHMGKDDEAVHLKFNTCRYSEAERGSTLCWARTAGLRRTSPVRKS